jgi:oxygen-independent coproporphyrinogen-3 oxidase
LAESRADQPLSLYLHLPWCRVRCGYCDFNTYVLPPKAAADVVPAYLDALGAELALAARILGPRRVETVYFGGGTPTLLAPFDFASLLRSVRAHFDLAAGAEVTAEANPETLSPAYLAELRSAGVARLSLGMQSACPAVLAVLERVHTPLRAVEAVAWARAAGFSSVSLDLIYGAPGETLVDWAGTLDVALAAAPDHVSAYSLIPEEGTKLAARMARGELPYPDDDDLADKYTLADERFEAAGLPWYEVSNWARLGHGCRHNLAYWRSADWWGFGAGAHSHVAGCRWWNERRPEVYRDRLRSGLSPAQGREELTAAQRHFEQVLLSLRLAEGLDMAVLSGPEAVRADGFAAAGLAVVGRRGPGRFLRLTQSGRLLADRLAAELLD